jgi:hypothetical protein
LADFLPEWEWVMIFCHNCNFEAAYTFQNALTSRKYFILAVEPRFCDGDSRWALTNLTYTKTSLYSRDDILSGRVHSAPISLEQFPISRLNLGLSV